jgi:gamma-glutamyl-gamma-aminobutyrate hydrolase PuuD
LYGQENCHPATYATEPLLDTYAALLTLAAYETHTPIFGVYGGAQRIAVALGGTLIQHIPGHRADPVAPGNYIHTDLSIDPALLAQCVSGGGSSPEPYQPSQAEYGCCMHHQAIATLPEGVQAWAMSGDIIEGYGFVGPWFAIGTLFHAEAPPFTGVQAYLFQAFSSACSAFNPTKRAANSPAGRRHALERMLSNVSVQRFLSGVTR